MDLSDTEAELVAHQALDRLQSGHRLEDQRVEVKPNWSTEPAHVGRAARQLAGHINAARGEPVIWVVGASEQTGEIVDSPEGDLDSWWAAIRSWMPEPPPAPRDRMIHHDGLPVTVLLFDSSYAPLSVYLSRDGQRDKNQAEVPWRELTGTRSATKRDLQAMLLPRTQAPLFEILGGTLRYTEKTSEAPGQAGGTAASYHWSLEIDMYCDLPGGVQVTIPDHRVHCRIHTDAPGLILDASMQTPLRPSRSLGGTDASGPGAMSIRGERQLILHGSGPIRLSARAALPPFTQNALPRTLEWIDVELKVELPDLAMEVRTSMSYDEDLTHDETLLGLWLCQVGDDLVSAIPRSGMAPARRLQAGRRRPETP